MSQILHIFKKDTRHLGLEILASLFITGLFTVLYPQQWRHGFYPAFRLAITGNLVTALVPVSWWVMMTRLIHGEPLVGDQQFWITRPYQWQKLLAAKVLFVAAFLYLPLLAAQCLMLHQAGFHPSSYLLGLFYNLLLLTTVALLPIAVLAVVTSKFSQTALALLAVIVYIAALVTITSSLYPPQVNVSTPADSILWGLLCSLGVAIVWLQYSTRNLRLSRLLLLAIVVIVGVCALAPPNSALLRSTFPPLVDKASPPVQLRFDANSPRKVTINPGGDAKEIWLNIPLTVSDIAPGIAVRQEAVMVTMTAPNGLHWSSRWVPLWQYFTSTHPDTLVTVPVNLEFFQKIKGLPVRVQLSWASTRLRAGITQQVAASDDRFTLPDGEICSVASTELLSTVACKFAVRQSRLFLFSADWSHLPCSQLRSAENTLAQASGWLGSLDSAPADLGISPVWSSSLNFSNQYAGTQNYSGHQFLCPGTPIRFTNYTLVDRNQFDLVIPEMRIFEEAPSSQTSEPDTGA